ncbi:MAG TPA: RNA-directed DNA polymerase, partial [Methyloprofundus sp.]|nr:RNA-directed DNA polymerase [Methyloprofundus sp.]
MTPLVLRFVIAEQPKQKLSRAECRTTRHCIVAVQTHHCILLKALQVLDSCPFRVLDEFVVDSLISVNRPCRPTPLLTQPATFNLDGRFMARWSADDKCVISQAKETISGELKGKLSAYCTHVKGHGGVKKSLRLLTRVIPEFRYAARFDVARYYESIDHAVLLSQLKKLQVSQHSQDIVQQYLALPDRRNSGKGMIASGSLSPLLAAVMLTPLDKTMEAEIRKGHLWYIRYMDDFVVLAKTRHQFRKAIKQVHAV